MPREREEVCPHRLHIHFDMRHTLRAVDNEDGTDGMGTARYRLDVVHEPEHIGHMRHGNNLGLFRNLRGNIGRREISILFEVDVFQCCTACLGNKLPRHKVAVMFGDGNDNLVACLHMGTPITVCNKIQRLRGILRKDNLLGACRTDKFLRTYTRRLIDVRCLDRKFICAAVWICIPIGAVIGNRLDDGLRFLRGCTVIEIDDGTAVHFCLQNRKILQILVEVLTHFISLPSM